MIRSLVKRFGKRRHAPPLTTACTFPGSEKYWETRYQVGGTSGAGSYGDMAAFKAEVLNCFVAANRVESVVEFGCGDGNQLRLSDYPRYVGYDISKTAVANCRRLFKDDKRKAFYTMDEYIGEQADLSLSLDVIYHLVEDCVFNKYMETLFGAARRYVIIYSSNTSENEGYHGTHVWHRTFTEWIDRHRSEWCLCEIVPNRYPYNPATGEGSFADFYIYRRAVATES